MLYCYFQNFIVEVAIDLRVRKGNNNVQRVHQMECSNIYHIRHTVMPDWFLFTQKTRVYAIYENCTHRSKRGSYKILGSF